MLEGLVHPWECGSCRSDGALPYSVSDIKILAENVLKSMT